MGYVWFKWFWQHQISFLVPLFNCNTNVWPWKMNFSNIYNDIVVKIAEDGPCAEPRSSQPLPHISYHREQTLPASQVSCWDLEKITLFLGLSVVTKVRDPEVTIINLKLCRTFGPAVAVTILEGWRKYNKLTSPAVVSLQTQLEVLLRLDAYSTSWMIELETTNTIQIIKID